MFLTPWLRSVRSRIRKSSNRSRIRSASRGASPAPNRLEALEDRTLLSTITWTNRGNALNDTDLFGDTFGANADVARGVVDAVLQQWEEIIVDWNRPTAGNNIDVTINMAAGGTGFGGSAGTGFTAGYPTSGNVNLLRGNDITGDGVGDGDGWYLDPAPLDNVEFDGSILHAFTADTSATSPANGMFDFYTLFNLELTHVLGITSSGLALIQNPLSGQVVDTGIADFAEAGGVGTYFVFDGPSVTHLMTSNNGGAGGNDTGALVHSAGPLDPAQPIAFTSLFRGNIDLTGAQDHGNAIFEGSRRYGNADFLALIIQDAYDATVSTPTSVHGNFYQQLDTTTGELIIRGGENGLSDDVISITRSGTNLIVSTNIGNDTPGTGPNGDGSDIPAYVTSFDATLVNSIRIDSGDGDDSITFDLSGGNVIPLGGGSINAGTGTNTLTVTGTASSVTHGFGALNAGSLAVDGNSVTFSGISLVTDTVVAPAKSLQFSVIDDTVTFDDDGNTMNGLNRVTAVGSGATLLFQDATATRSVLFGDGDDTWDYFGQDPASAAVVTLNGQDGTDTIDASIMPSAVIIIGGMDDDTLTGTDFDDTISGNDGDDLIEGNDGNDLLIEAGDVDFALTNTTLTGLGNDMLTSIELAQLTGGASDNTIDASAFNGQTTLSGLAGDDALAGGTLSDSLSGGSGDDEVKGGDGDDILVDETGNDSLNGDAGNDTISTGTGNDVVTGGDDDDFISVNYIGGATIVNGGAGVDQVFVIDSGLGVAGSIDISGGDGTDIFAAAPLLGGTLDFHGNDPVFGTSPGDLLSVFLLDPAIMNTVIVDNVNGGALDGTGSVTSSSHGLMTWDGIEGLNLLNDPDLVVDADDALPFGGDGADSGDIDSFRLFRSGAFGLLEIDGSIVGVFPVGFLTSITVNGSMDNDTLTVDLSTGPLPVPITYNGLTAALDNDQLRIDGSGTETGVYVPSATVNGNGVITVDGNDITFTDLEPIEVTNVASFTLQTPNSLDDINLSADRNFANTDDALLISGTSGGLGFESLRVLDVVDLTIDLAAGDGASPDDTVTIENGALLFDPTDLLTNITILAGQGNDTFVIEDSEFQLPGGGTLTLDGGVATDTIRVIAQNDAAEDDVALTLVTAGPNATLTSTAGAMPASIQLLRFSGEIAAITGNATDNLIDLSGWSVNNQQSTASVIGGSGSDPVAGDDTLIGFNDDTVWSITNAFGPDSGDATGIHFENIDNLVGGAGNDNFVLQDGVVFTGTVTGGAGIDQFDLSDFTTSRTVTLTASTALGFDGASVAVTGGFFGIDGALGGLSIDDSLQGLDVDSTWELDGSNRYIDDLGRVLGFDSFENLQGGNGNDEFQITGTPSNNLLGGSGNDRFSFQLAFSQVVGRVDGETGSDTLDLAAFTTQRLVTLTATTANGYTGTEASVTADFFGIDVVVGGIRTTDVLNGLSVDARWDVSGDDQGTYTESSTARLLGFSQIENINGSDGVDTFEFSNSATLTGSLTGGNGSDALIGDDSRASEIFVVNAVNAGQFVSVTGVIIGGTYSGIETLIGATGQDTFQFANSGSLAGIIDGVGGNDTIIGDNDGNQFTVLNNDSGNLTDKINTSGVAAAAFINVENLTGGAGVDTFTIDSLLVGDLSGRSGNDSFFFGATGSIGGTLFGGPGFDTLIGDDDGNLFNIQGNGVLAATGRGTLVTKTSEFQKVENLVGGGGADTFSFARLGSIIGTIDGISGNDTLVGDDGGNNFSVSTMNAGLLSGKMTAFANIQNLEGGAGNDTFNINATLAGDVKAFVGDDTIIVNTSGTVGGDVDAGALDDFVEIRGHVVGDVLGGTQNDTIVFQDGSSVDGTVFGNDGDDLFSIRGVVTLLNPLMGDAGNDTFEFFNTGAIDQAILGGSGSDTINGDDDGNVFTITGPDSGTLPGKVDAGYSSIENLGGGDGVDIFNINASFTGSLSGMAGDDQFIIAPGQAVGGDINGDAGDDTITVGDAATVAGTISGGGDDDTLIVDHSDTATRTLVYDGGAGDDLLRLTGTMAGSTTYSVGPAADAGTIVTTGTEVQTILFSGLEPVEDLMTLATLIINASIGADVINIIDAPTSGRTEVNFNGAFELIRFENKTTVTVNGDDPAGGGGDDVININNPNPANGLVTLNVNGLVGNDTVNILVDHTGNLTGGTGNDAFVFSNGVQLTGTLDGKGGTDTVNASALSTSLTFDLTSSTGDGFSGTETSLLAGAGTFAGIDSIRGGAAADQINGLDVDSAWEIDGTNSYTDDAATLAFSLLETLNGGSRADVFNVSGFQSETLSGGAGDDQLNMTANGAFLDGFFDGGAGTDTVSLAGLTTGQTVTLTANRAVDGFDGTTSTILGGFQNVDSLAGGAGADTLTGMDVVAVWGIGGLNTYEDDLTNRTVDFSGFENLQGGLLKDTFNVAGAQTANLLGGAGDDNVVFSDGATLIGTINGESGSDLVDYSAFTTTVTALAGDFTSIEEIIGGSSGTDVIAGGPGADVFAVTDMNQGTVNGIAFSAFESLDGRDGNDSFTMQTSGTLAGGIEGGNGSDGLTISKPVPVTVNITGPGVATLDAAANGIAGNETSIAGGFNNINSVTSGGTDTLNGANAVSTWDLGTTNTYTVSGQSATFSGFRTLNGGSSADTFNVSSAVVFDVNGNDGDDSLDISAGATLSGDFLGGMGADTLGLGTGASLSGMFNGGVDLDTVSFATSTSSVSVDLTAGSATGYAGTVAAITGGFVDVDNLVGSSGSGDTLSGLDVDSVWTINVTNAYSNMTDSVSFSSFEMLNGGLGADAFNVSAAETTSLIGNGGDDTFNFLTDAAALTGSISGGTNSNSLSFSGLTAVAVDVVLTGNTVSGFAGTVASLVSGGFTDMFLLAGGGSASDTLTGQNVSSAWDVDFMGDTYRDDATGRILDFSAFENLTGGTLDDSFTIDGQSTLGGSISDLGGGDVVTVESNAFGSGGNVVGGISTGAEADIVRIEDDATVAGTIDTGAGDDLVEIAYEGGTTRALNLNLGSGNDDLLLDGSDATAVIDYTVGPGLDQGSLVTTIAADTQTVTFSGLSPTGNGMLIDRQAGAVININGSSSADIITVQDGLQNITFFTEVDFNGASVPIQFQNKVRAVVNGMANADTINLNNPLTATLLQFVNVNGGDGNDTINVQVDHNGDLNGGAGDDTFAFFDGAQLTGETGNPVVGGSGTDTVDVSAFTTATPVSLNLDSSDGFEGMLSAAITNGPFTGIDNVLAGSGTTDTLTGLDMTASWQIDGTNTYTDTFSVRSLSFAGFEGLTGNKKADVFEISGSQDVTIDGSLGNDIFRFVTDGAQVTGDVLGDEGVDVLDFSAFSSSSTLSVVLDSGGGVVNGYFGNAGPIGGTFGQINSILGGDSVSDSLTGVDGGGTWVVNEPGSYTDTLNGETLNFSNFESLNGNDGVDTFDIQDGSFNLSGGNDDDVFNVADNVTLTGTINGDDSDPDGDGTMDRLSFAASGSSIAFSSALVTNVEIIEGSGNGDDTLLGTDGNDVFEISDAGVGTVNGAGFMDFANLDGGLGDDSFQFTDDLGSLTGSIQGGAGSDTLGFSGVTTNVSVALTGAGGVDGIDGTETGGSVNGFSNINGFEGGTGAVDSLTGLNVSSIWTIGTTNTYTAASSSVNFILNTASAFEVLVGQGQDDVFNVSGTQAVSITAGSGADEVNLAAAAMLTGTVSTGAGDDLLTFGTGAVITGTLNAGNDDDTLDFTGSSTSVDITLTMANAGGGFDGNAVALVSGGFAGVEDIAGGSGSNSLAGVDSDSTWTIGVTNNYAEDAAPLNVLNFSGVGMATGGTGMDSFNVADSTSLDLFGGANDDVFSVSGSANVTGSLNGDAGDDTFIFSGAVVVPAGLDGGADTDNVSFETSILAVSINLDTFNNIETVTGSNLNDTIVGSSGNDAFTVTGSSDNGNVVSGGVTTTFVDFENLSGAAGVDSFSIVGNTVGLSGGIDGGADSDTIDYSDYTTGVTVDLVAGSATNIAGGISTLENVTGGSGNDVITGDAENNSLSGNGGEDMLADGGGDDMLDGGADNDTYLLTPGSADVVTDASGIDVLDFSRALAGVTFDLDNTSSSSNTVQLSGTFENFVGSDFDDDVTSGDAVLRSIGGGDGNDTIRSSANGPNVWTISGNDAGSFVDAAQTVSFTDVENLFGGDGNDGFLFDDGFAISGTVNGGIGVDTLDFSAYAAGNAVDLDLANLTGIDTAIGGAGSDTISGDDVATLFRVSGQDEGDINSVLDFQNFENLAGGSADDTFVFDPLGTLTDGIDGGGATMANLLTLSASDDDVTLNGLSVTIGFDGTVLESAATVTGFSNINSISGNGGTDSLTGLDAISDWTLNDGTADAYASGGRSLAVDDIDSYVGRSFTDTFNINGVQSVSLDGGTGDDRFTLANGASQTSVIAGGGGTDTIDFAGATAEMITLASGGFTGISSSIASFSAIDVVDGTGLDTLSGILGAAGTFNIDAGGNTYQAIGSTLSFSGVATVVGSALADVFNITGPNAVNLETGGGNDQIILLTDASSLTGTIDGGSGSADVFDLSNLTMGRIVDATSLANVEVLIGTSGSDTLVGSVAGSLFQVTSSSAGIVDGTLNFTSIETLQGGTGSDTLDLASLPAARDVQLSGVTSDGFTGSDAAIGVFSGMNTIRATAMAGDSVTGLNSAATFDLDGTPTYAAGGGTLALSEFEVFSGNAGQDAFVISGTQSVTANGGAGDDSVSFADGAVLNGVFSGGSGTDTVDLGSYTSSLSIELTALGTTDGFQVQAAGPLGSSADSVDAVIGGSGSDQMTGLNAVASWSIGMTDSYTSSSQTLAIQNVELRIGGTGNDTFAVQADALAAATNELRGGSGNDVFAVNFVAGTSLATGAMLSINGNDPTALPANRDTVNVNVNASGDGARTIDLAFQSASTGDLNISGLGATSINLLDIESFSLNGDLANDDTVTVTGTGNSDNLTVTPAASGASVFLNGMTDFVSPGVAGGGDGPDISISGVSQTGLTVDGAAGSTDQILYDGSGSLLLTSSSSGKFTQSGVVDVNFVNIETQIAAMGIAFVLDAEGDADDGTADNFLVELNAGRVEVSVNSTLLLSETPGNISGLTINGSSDADSLTVDFSAGDPIPTNLQFNGGTDRDTLITIGGMSGVYTPGAVLFGIGSLTIDGSAISYTGVEPLAASNLTNLTLVTPNDAGIVSLSNTGGQDRVSGSSGGVTFQPLQLTNVASIIVDAATNSTGGVDSITSGNLNSTSLTINTGSGADTINASAVLSAALTVNAGAGDDVITTGAAINMIDGGAGTDSLLVSGTNVVLTDTSLNGAGTLAGIEIATLTAGPTASQLDASGAASVRVSLIGGAGDDVLLGGAGNDTISGNGGNDSITGGSGTDILRGGIGNDTLRGGFGDDNLDGDSGNDLLAGDRDNDLLRGGVGDDSLVGGPGIDTLQGDTGGDTLRGGDGNDIIDGGAGIDSVVELAAGNITITNTQLIAAGTDSLSNFEVAELTAGPGNDVINATGFTSGLRTFLAGGAGDDRIFGTNFTDVIVGQNGNDLIAGFSGWDLLQGGAGNDTVFGGTGNDTIDGGSGTDNFAETADVNFVLTDTQLTGLGTDTIISAEIATLKGGASNNTINASGAATIRAMISGMGGADTLTGGAARDTINGGSGNDVVDGGAGIDQLTVAADANLTTTDSQTTGDGTDTFSNFEVIVLRGGAGANRLDASGATLPTILRGSAGNDTLVGGAGVDRLEGNSGTDRVELSGTSVVLTDASFNGTDSIISIEIVDVTAGSTASLLDASGFTLTPVNLVGGAGNDSLFGTSGNDTLNGNGGDDTVAGGSGNDIVNGADGNDLLIGGAGNDQINGGNNNDTIDGGAGNDTLNGDNGNDSIRGGADADTINGGANEDTIFGDGGDDSVIGGAGNDGIAGGAGNDYLLGDFGNDTILGQAGNDILLGSGGSDVVVGGDGDDLVRGNGGIDTLAGNAGVNTFIGLPGEIDENFSDANFPFLL